jgi:hypothetical protein
LGEEKIFHGKLRPRYRPWSNFRRRKETVWIAAAPSLGGRGPVGSFSGKDHVRVGSLILSPR